MASVLYQPIMVALMARLQDKCGALFNTYSRKFVTWEQLTEQLRDGTQNPLPQPACLLYDGPGFGGGITTYVQGGRTPDRRTVLVTVVIYAQTANAPNPSGPDPDAPGADTFYPLIEAVEDAIEPDPGDQYGTLTLGGLVTHCWIEGNRVLIPGDIDVQGQGMATIPVNILIP